MILVVDVSWCQGGAIDWPRVKAAGCELAIVKVAEGLAGVDPNGRKNLDGARAAGIHVAAYDFVRPSQGHAEDQVEALWRAIGDELPALAPLDLETAPADMAPAAVLDFAERWEEAARARFGRYQPFYSFDWFIVHQMGPLLAGSKVMAQCPLWIAQPSWPKPGLPPDGMRPIVHPPWSDYTLWQFSSDNSKGVAGTLVPGIPTIVDRNVFNGTLDDLRAFLGLPTAEQLEPEAPIVHPNLDLTRPDTID